MDFNQVDKSKEYIFLEAWQELLSRKDVVITSENTRYSYKIYELKDKIKLKFYNPIISSWQICSFLLQEEIFGIWYVTKISNV
jgi:hypothetical protein